MSSSVSARDAQLGSGLLILTIGIGMAELRMSSVWGKGVLMLIALAVFVALFIAALRAPQGEESEDPSAMTSLLCALAFAYGAVAVYWLGRIIEPHHTFAHAGTVTWMLALVMVIAAALGSRRRSATLVLVALVAFSLLVFEGLNWLFDIGRDQSTYRYIAAGLVVIYMLTAASIRLWPRLASVLYVAAGALLFVMAETMYGLDLGHVIGIPLFLVGVIPKAPFGWIVAIGLGTLALAAAATVRRDPGPGYLAALVTLSWVTLAAAPQKHLTIVGWPLFALIVGAVIVVIAVTDTNDNRFSLTRAPEMLAAGSYMLGVGVLLMIERMAFLWPTETELVIAVVAAVLFVVFALVQQVEGNEPSGAVSMLTAIALGAVVLALVREARDFHGAFPLGVSAIGAWVAGLSAVAGAGLAWFRRSAGIALASIILFGLAILSGAIHFFHAQRHPVSFTWILVGLCVLYGVLAVLTRGWWPRLATVSAVAAGGAVIGAMVTLRFGSIAFLPGQLVKGTPSPAWVVLAVAAAVAMAGAAALLARAAGPGYVAAGLALFAVTIDAKRVVGHEASLLLWPVLWLAVGAGLAAVGLAAGRSGGAASSPAPAET